MLKNSTKRKQQNCTMYNVVHSTNISRFFNSSDKLNEFENVFLTSEEQLIKRNRFSHLKNKYVSMEDCNAHCV